MRKLFSSSVVQMTLFLVHTAWNEGYMSKYDQARAGKKYDFFYYVKIFVFNLLLYINDP